MEKRRFKIGVMGKAGRSKVLPDILVKNAKIIGKTIAEKGHILVTGACMGVPHIAAKAATQAGGLVLGYSPAKNLREHREPPISYPSPTKNTILLFTGYGKVGRNILSIFECDGVIFIGGGIGTLNEFSIAAHEGKVIGILEGTKSVVEKIVDQIKKEGNGKSPIVIKEKNPRKLVVKVIQAIVKHQENPKKEVPFSFKNKNGHNLVGVLHLPEKEKPPLVIICHGFQGTKTERKIVLLARRLQEIGILVCRFDFEGCGDSEGDPKEITVENEVSDVYLAYKNVLKQCDINPTKIGLVGESLGSVIATLAIIKFKIPAKTVVFWSQAFDQKSLLKKWYQAEEIRKLKEKGFIIRGQKEIGHRYYYENRNKDYSIYLSRLNVPVLLIHGGKDEDVPLEFSQKLANKYPNITLKILKKANHKFEDFTSQRQLISLTARWFKKHL